MCKEKKNLRGKTITVLKNIGVTLEKKGFGITLKHESFNIMIFYVVKTVKCKT